MANPTSAFTGSIDGTWLIPHVNNTPVLNAEAWIGATSPPLTAEYSMDEFTIFNRPEELAQMGVLHLDRGQVDDGLLLARNGQTAATWLTRLQNIIQNQRSYSYVLLSCTAWQPFRVRIGGLSKSVTIAGGLAYRVSFPFSEVT